MAKVRGGLAQARGEIDMIPDELSVFINCPYDRSYRPFMWAQIFAVYDSGFAPTAAIALNDATTTRLDRIVRLIKACRYSVHDLSIADRPRFNMPFELGLALGIARAGVERESDRSIAILVTDKTKYEDACSDLKGIDPIGYRNAPSHLVYQITRWLNGFKVIQTLPGPAHASSRFEAFWRKLPEFAKQKGFDRMDATWGEMVLTVNSYLRHNPPTTEPGRRRGGKDADLSRALTKFRASLRAKNQPPPE